MDSGFPTPKLVYDERLLWKTTMTQKQNKNFLFKTESLFSKPNLSFLNPNPAFTSANQNSFFRLTFFKEQTELFFKETKSFSSETKFSFQKPNLFLQKPTRSF